jgi:hypothetical protein
MVRIGNGTQIKTPIGDAIVTYRQRNTSLPNGQTQTDYIRYIAVNGQTDNGTRITSNYQGALVPTSNTLLGLLLRDGYPPGISNPPSFCSSGQTTSCDTGNRGDARPYFFTKVFQSSNNYVLVYRVSYPPTPILSSMLSNPYVPKGGNDVNNITGTLTDPSGQPVTSKTLVVLQYAKPGDNSWTSIGSSTLTTSGTYQFLNWNKVPSGIIPIRVRAWWNGDPGLGLNIALSANQTLIQL